MTKDKAKTLLDNLIGMVEDNQKSDYDTALRMGIQALSQEPTDTWSIKDVADTFKKHGLIREQEPTFDDECQKDMDEAWEQIQKKRKRIPVTLDLTPCDDAISRDAVLNAIEREDKWLLAAKGHNGLTEIAFSGLKARVDALPSVTQKPNMTWVTGADGAKIAFNDVPVWKVTKICEILGEPQERSDKE